MRSATTYAQLRSRLTLALGLNTIIITAEFVGGFLLNSIGLMSDAGHNLIDQGCLFLALYAHLLTTRPASEARTFGYHRAGVVAAFLSSFVLLLTAGGIALIGVKRLLYPVPVEGGWVMAVAGLSFAANLGIALLLQRDAQDDLNIRGAFWHMLGDAWVSLGVVVSGGAILWTGWTILDPVMSLLVVGVILKGAWPLFKESMDVLLESTPPGISASHVAATIEAIPGVISVHDLHIWAVEPRLVMLTCHVIAAEDDTVSATTLLHAIRARVTADFGINHVTIQMGTSCCHAEAIHCDLSKLAARHENTGVVHAHH